MGPSDRSLGTRLFGRYHPRENYFVSNCLLGKQIYEFFVSQSPFENSYPDSLAWELTGMIGELPQNLRSRFNFERFVNPDGL